MDASGIRLFAMDVDGTLTDGALTLAADGAEWKTFHARDGLGIQLLPRAGITPAIISGRASEVTARRARELGVDLVFQGISDKAACLAALCEQLDLEPRQAAFVGDDLSDIPPMRIAGWSAAPSDAAPETRAAAEFVSSLPGGRGAVRQAVEALLVQAGRWQEVLDGLEPTQRREVLA